jgi:HlyD family secretion protein
LETGMNDSPGAASARDRAKLQAPAAAPGQGTASPKLPSLKKYGLAALIAILVVAGIGLLVWRISAKGGMEYATAPVTRGKVSRTATATGTVNPVLTIIVGTYVSGVIQNIYCDYNTRVRAGQVCAKIDPRPYQASLDQYSGQLLRDQAILSKDQTDLTRYQQLSAENSIARQQAEDQGYVVSQDEATVKLDQALVQSAQLNLDYTNYHLAGRWNGRLAQCDGRPDCRCQLPDTNFVPHRKRPQTNGGRYKH